MKKILILMLITMATSLSFAQDVITLKSSTLIFTKVLTVSDEVIKYKHEFGTLSVDTEDVLMSTYANGEHQYFQKFTEEEFRDLEIDDMIHYNAFGIKYNGGLTSWAEAGGIMVNNQDAYKQYKSGRGMAIGGTILCIVGGVATLTSGGFLLAASKLSISNTTGFTIGLTTSVVALGGGITLAVIGTNKVKRSFETYNESVTKSKNTANLSLGISDTGGLALRLNF